MSAAGASSADAPAVPVPAVPASAQATVKQYRIHMSSRYVDVTKQKLELVRLPHEGSGADRPRHAPLAEWWEPKTQVDGLIDFWLAEYSWREREKDFNARLPQFRAKISIPSDPPISSRIHYVHIRSARPNAVPLLLIPPFPFSSLLVGHLIRDLADPEGPAGTPAFHVVCPSLPGLAFTDALPSNTPLVAATARLFDGLMRKLEYPAYLASNSGPGASSPAQIDWRIARWLATRHADSCLGVHLIAPPFEPPQRRTALVDWIKWSVVRRLRRPLFKYTRDDLSALEQTGTHHIKARKKDRAASDSSSSSSSKAGGKTNPRIPFSPTKALDDIGALLTTVDPNALAYGLCDSPTGLLVVVLKLLRVLGAKDEFSQQDIIDFAELAWLPGPENMLRFWAHCAKNQDADVDVVLEAAEDAQEESAEASEKRSWRTWSAAGKANKDKKGQPEMQRPRVVITTFSGRDEGAGSAGDEGLNQVPAQVPASAPVTGDEAASADTTENAAADGETTVEANVGATTEITNETAPADDNRPESGSSSASSSRPAESVSTPYSCPLWGRRDFDILHVHHAPGQPGLLAWSRPEVVLRGIRDLAARVAATDAGARLAADPATDAHVGAVSTNEKTATHAEPSPADASTTPAGSPAILSSPTFSAPGASGSSSSSHAPLLSPSTIGLIPKTIPELDETQDTSASPASFPATASTPSPLPPALSNSTPSPLMPLLPVVLSPVAPLPSAVDTVAEERPQSTTAQKRAALGFGAGAGAPAASDDGTESADGGPRTPDTVILSPLDRREHD